jgi:hypothetical protein
MEWSARSWSSAGGSGGKSISAMCVEEKTKTWGATSQFQCNLISRAIAEQLNNQPFFWDFANHVMFLYFTVVSRSLLVMKSKHKHNNWG